jgi:hypothetical protein
MKSDDEIPIPTTDTIWDEIRALGAEKEAKLRAEHPDWHGFVDITEELIAKFGNRPLLIPLDPPEQQGGSEEGSAAEDCDRVDD